MRATLAVASMLLALAGCERTEAQQGAAPPRGAPPPQPAPPPALKQRPLLQAEDFARALEGRVLSAIDDNPKWQVQSRMDCGAAHEAGATYVCRVRVNDSRATSGAQVIIYLYRAAGGFDLAVREVRDYVAQEVGGSTLENEQTFQLRQLGYPELRLRTTCLQGLRASTRAYCLTDYGRAVVVAHVAPTQPDPNDDLKSPDIDRAAELGLFAMIDLEAALGIPGV